MWWRRWEQHLQWSVTLVLKITPVLSCCINYSLIHGLLGSLSHSEDTVVNTGILIIASDDHLRNAFSHVCSRPPDGQWSLWPCISHWLLEVPSNSRKAWTQCLLSNACIKRRILWWNTTERKTFQWRLHYTVINLTTFSEGVMLVKLSISCIHSVAELFHH